MNIKTAIQIFIFLLIIISLYLFIKMTFLSEKQEIIDLDLEKKEVKAEKIDIKESSGNIIENIDYKSIDANGNEYNLHASRGEISNDNENIIILKNVSGELRLKDKPNIYIKSDYAKYNSLNFDTYFYQNVSGFFENKKIYSDNFDLLFKDNKAMIYNNIKFLDINIEGSADKIKLDLLTGDIIITMREKEKIQVIKK
jgi:hypothetical protein|tara:strand:+ start:346 stop:939 length:594 start_codon:yes stop_codon:yes gene_type:complete